MFSVYEIILMFSVYEILMFSELNSWQKLINFTVHILNYIFLDTIHHKSMLLINAHHAAPFYNNT